MRPVTFFALAAAFAVTLTTTAPCDATQAVQRVKLVYAVDADAAASCPDTSRLREAIQKRLGYDPVWEWAPQTLVVQVWRDRARYAGRVVFVGPQGLSTTRDYPPDDDCEQLVDALALGVSIALDIALPSSPPQPSEPEAPAPPAPPTPEAPTDRPSRSADRPTRARASRAPRGWFALGGGAFAWTGIAPKPAFGAVGFAQVRTGAASVAVEGRAGASPTADSFQAMLVAAGVVPCLWLGPTFVCAVTQIGWLQAEGVGPFGGASSGAPFVVLGGRAGVEIPLSIPLFVRLQDDLLVEVDGPRFALPEAGFEAPGAVYPPTPTPTLLFHSALGSALTLTLGAYFP